MEIEEERQAYRSERRPSKPDIAAVRCLVIGADPQLTFGGEEPAPVMPQPGERLVNLLAHGNALMATKGDAEVLPDSERLTQRDTCSVRSGVRPR